MAASALLSPAHTRVAASPAESRKHHPYLTISEKRFQQIPDTIWIHLQSSESPKRSLRRALRLLEDGRDFEPWTQKEFDCFGLDLEDPEPQGSPDQLEFIASLPLPRAWLRGRRRPGQLLLVAALHDFADSIRRALRAGRKPDIPDGDDYFRELGISTELLVQGLSSLRSCNMPAVEMHQLRISWGVLHGDLAPEELIWGTREPAWISGGHYPGCASLATLVGATAETGRQLPEDALFVLTEVSQLLGVMPPAARIGFLCARRAEHDCDETGSLPFALPGPLLAVPRLWDAKLLLGLLIGRRIASGADWSAQTTRSEIHGLALDAGLSGLRLEQTHQSLLGLLGAYEAIEGRPLLVLVDDDARELGSHG